MTIAAFFREQRALAEKWRAEADDRLRRWPADPVGATLGYQAAELLETLRRLELELGRLTTVEFAEERGVSPQTVSRWIRNGYLTATKGRRGYEIPRGARVVRARQRRAAKAAA